MFGRKPKKHGLYYLLPGMTRANREKRKRIFRWSLIVGTLAAGITALIIYFVNRPPQP
jgi:RNA processing factor Prp31